MVSAYEIESQKIRIRQWSSICFGENTLKYKSKEVHTPERHNTWSTRNGPPVASHKDSWHLPIPCLTCYVRMYQSIIKRISKHLFILFMTVLKINCFSNRWHDIIVIAILTQVSYCYAVVHTPSSYSLIALHYYQ